jgi:hypothetical protein
VYKRRDFYDIAVVRGCNGQLGQSRGAVCKTVRVWNFSYENEKMWKSTPSREGLY